MKRHHYGQRYAIIVTVIIIKNDWTPDRFERMKICVLRYATTIIVYDAVFDGTL